MPNSTYRTIFIALIGCGTLAATTLAGRPRPSQGAGYPDVQALLNASCMPCHSATRRTHGLDLSSYEGIMAGGRNGRAVIARDAANSELVKALRGTGAVGLMPPGSPVSPDRIKMVEDWVNAGALANGGAPTLPPPVEKKPPYAGRQYLITFDGENGKESVNFLDAKSIRVNHFTEGGSPETVTATHDEIGPNIFMFSWQERDKSIVTQVIDLDKNVAYQTTASGNKLTHAVGLMKRAGQS